MKVDAIQSFFMSAGKYSCYADCIIRLAAEQNGVSLTLRDVGEALDKGIDAGYISFNTGNYADYDNFYVTNPAGFMGLLTGKRWAVSKERADYNPRKGELVIDFKVLSEADAKKNVGHFVLPGWDPIQNSNTGRNGFVWTRRVFRRLG